MAEIKTQMFIPKPMRSASLLLIDNRRKPILIQLKGDATIGRDYPESDRDIRICSEIVGRVHGEFIHDDSADNYYYLDNNSLNGSFVNGIKLQPYNERGSSAVKLSDGDIIRIDRNDLSHPHPHAVLMVFSRSFEPGEKWAELNISDKQKITIGRENGNVMKLEDDMASRFHAEIIRTEQGFVISDLRSQNGVYVNRNRIFGSTYIHNNDVIKIANTLLIFNENSILYNNNSAERSGCLSVEIYDKTVGVGRKKKALIRDIRFEADTGDFILILGGSGAGKTTLINSIVHEIAANARVMLDGQNLYENLDLLHSQIGIVPQFLNLRENDKVISTLLDISKLKLKHYSKQERIDRINKILNKLGIANLQNHLIRQLSGGQKKKVSVAAQLVGFQKVFICDEPDSGLDAASRMQQMEILSDISQSGKIVMVISHEPDDAIDRKTGQYLFSKVLVLAKSSADNCGHLAFYGGPYEALEHFGVKKLQDIMVQINPPHEGGSGNADYFINKFKGE